MKPSEALEGLLVRARAGAARRRHMFCAPEHVLRELLLGDGFERAADLVECHLDELRAMPFDPPRVELSRQTRTEMLPAAESAARTRDAVEIEPADVLEALLVQGSPLNEELRRKVVDAMATPEPRRIPAAGPPGSTGSDSSILQPLAPAGESELVDRPELVENLLLTLSYGHPLLVGPAGSGRRSVIRLAARRLADGEVPPSLRGLTLKTVDPGRLLAGTAYRGQLEERVQKLLRALAADEGKAVLVLEDLHRIVPRREGSGGIDLVSQLLTGMRKGEFRLLATTTHDDVRESIERQPSLLEMLDPIAVDEPPVEVCTKIVEHVGGGLRDAYSVELAPEAAAALTKLCRTHLPHRAMPGAALRLLRGAAARLAFEQETLREDSARSTALYWRRVGSSEAATGARLGERHLMIELSERYRVPFDHLDTGAEEKIRRFPEVFSKRIHGQGQVLTAIHDVVKVALTNIAKPERPRGGLFFVGPPGTGKTATARLLAKHLMGSEDALVFFNMSEYSSESASGTLIGSDAGLVRSEEGGRLTEPLRENPHRVVLFDEIEKAHPKVFDLFLRILEDGQILDKLGRVASFRHAICVFTSNLGCDGRNNLLGKTRQELEATFAGVFRQELIDRIDRFVPFGPLSVEARGAIARDQLKELARLLVDRHAVSLSWDDAVVAGVAERPDGQSGARDILRWVQLTVKPALVDALLEIDRDRRAGICLRLALEGGKLRVESGSEVGA